MKIYIPYSAARDLHKGLELRYALRSIEKYLTGWEEIILLGDAPTWYKGESVNLEDIPAKKETSIFRKMLWVPVKTRDFNFAMAHDDHFVLKPIDLKDFKQWHSGELSFEMKRPHSGRYGQALSNTFEKFPEGNYYDCHAPIVFNSASLMKLNWDKEYCLKTLYCNSFPGEQEFMQDLKFDNYVSKDYIKTLIKDRLFFSTGAMYDPMIEVLNELFPNPSKFER